MRQSDGKRAQGLQVYRKGVSVAKQAMQEIEARLERTEGLEDWFIKIVPQPQTG